jgi:hypothetical protein
MSLTHAKLERRIYIAHGDERRIYIAHGDERRIYIAHGEPTHKNLYAAFRGKRGGWTPTRTIDLYRAHQTPTGEVSTEIRGPKQGDSVDAHQIRTTYLAHVEST